MSENTKYSEQHIQNQSYNESLEIAERLVHGYDTVTGKTYAIAVDDAGKLKVDIDMATEGIATSAKQDTQILVNKGLVDLDYTFTRNADGSVATIATTDGVTTNTQTFVRDSNGAITAINSVIT